MVYIPDWIAEWLHWCEVEILCIKPDAKLEILDDMM